MSGLAVFVCERFRNAWANRCLICLFNPWHGEEEQK